MFICLIKVQERKVSLKKIIILTGAELRHTFFRKFIALSENIMIINSYCEGPEKSLRTFVDGQKTAKDLRSSHLMARERSEEDFFSLFVENTSDHSNPVFLPKGMINNSNFAEDIIASKPDLLVAYGCSIIKDPLLSTFKGRLINVHLGLSPYYRGAGTNYWPLVNAEPEFVGATFMHMDAGIDTGKIIHQIRARISLGDTPAQIGNRLITDMSRVYRRILACFDDLQDMPQLEKSDSDKYYKKSDYSEDSVRKLYDNFRGGMIQQYLTEKQTRWERAPIIQNPLLSDDAI